MAKKKSRTKKKAKRQADPGAAPGGPALRLEMMTGAELRGRLNAKNWRRHPASQRAAWRQIKAEVGWAGYVLLNEQTGRLIDGHMRVEEAPPEEVIPVVVGSWSEQQERLILASHDPLAAMAEIDAGAVARLLEQIETSQPAVHAMLELLEQEVDNSLSGEPAEDDDDEPGGGGDGDQEAGPGDAQIKGSFTVLVKCGNELEQQMLLDGLKGQGLKAKAVKV